MNKQGHSISQICLSPLGLAAKLNFNITKVFYLAKTSEGRDVNCQRLDDSPLVILNKIH